MLNLTARAFVDVAVVTTLAMVPEQGLRQDTCRLGCALPCANASWVDDKQHRASVSESPLVCNRFTVW